MGDMYFGGIFGRVRYDFLWKCFCFFILFYLFFCYYYFLYRYIFKENEFYRNLIVFFIGKGEENCNYCGDNFCGIVFDVFFSFYVFVYFVFVRYNEFKCL